MSQNAADVDQRVAVDAGALRDVREGAVGVVPIQPVGAVVGDQEVEVAVVVDVADGRAHAVAGVAGPGFPCRIAKDAIRILAEQPVAGAGLAIGVYEIHVEVPVAIVVEDSEPGSHHFRQQELAPDARGVVEQETELRGDINEPVRGIRRLASALCKDEDHQPEPRRALGQIP